MFWTVILSILQGCGEAAKLFFLTLLFALPLGLVVAFGSMARIARSAIRKLREEGLKAGLFRPKTLYPFPADALRALAPGRRFLVIEQNTGQMVEDVRLSLMGENAKVDWHGVMPGLFIGADALEDPIRQACKEN